METGFFADRTGEFEGSVKEVSLMEIFLRPGDRRCRR